MNYLQSLTYPSQTPPNVAHSQYKTSSHVKKNDADSSASISPRSSEIGRTNVDMLQAWVSGGSVSVAKPSAKQKNVAQNNAGQRLNFLG